MKTLGEIMYVAMFDQASWDGGNPCAYKPAWERLANDIASGGNISAERAQLIMGSSTSYWHNYYKCQDGVRAVRRAMKDRGL